MLSFRVKVSGPGGLALDAPQKALDRFATEAGEIIVNHVQELMGQSGIYVLSPAYAAKKQRLKQFRRIAGKAADQPLILSGEWYEHIHAHVEDGELIVTMDEGAAESQKGFDYATFLEEKSMLFQQALSDVEDRLPDLLLGIICEEMAL